MGSKDKNIDNNIIKKSKEYTTISKIQNNIIENKINELNIKCENIAKENEEIKRLIRTKVSDISKIYQNFTKANGEPKNIQKNHKKSIISKNFQNVQTDGNENRKSNSNDNDLLRFDTLELLGKCNENDAKKLLYYQPKVKYKNKKPNKKIVPRLNLVSFIYNYFLV